MLLIWVVPLWGQSGTPAQSLTPLTEPRAAPEPGRVALDGQQYGLADFEGRMVLVNFWATWCPPVAMRCRRWSGCRSTSRATPSRLVGVNLGESVGEFVGRIQDFLQTLPVLPAFPMLLDPDGSVSQAWQARVVPTTWVVDRKGRIVLGAVGEVDFDSPDPRGQIQALMPGSGDAAGIRRAPAP